MHLVGKLEILLVGSELYTIPALIPTGLDPSAIPDHHSIVKYIPDIYVRKIVLTDILSMMGGCVLDTHV